MISSELQKLLQCEYQMLLAYFYGKKEEALRYIRKDFSVAEASLQCEATTLVSCRLLLSYCRLLVENVSIVKVKEDEWKEINRITVLVVNVLQKFYGVDNALPENLSAHCYLGLSYFFLKQMNQANKYLQQGKKMSAVCDTHFILPEFGSVKDASSWDAWIRQCELPIQPQQALGTKTSSISTRLYKKDWDSIGKEIDKEILEDEQAITNSGGEQALQSLLKSIYQNSDSDTRRAMNKSYQLSGGTVLSTNWKDVQKNDFTKEASDALEKI